MEAVEWCSAHVVTEFRVNSVQERSNSGQCTAHSKAQASLVGGLKFSPEIKCGEGGWGGWCLVCLIIYSDGITILKSCWNFWNVSIKRNFEYTQYAINTASA